MDMMFTFVIRVRSNLKSSRRKNGNSTFSLGFDHCSNEYKVMHVFCNTKQHDVFGEIFTLRTDSRSRQIFALDTYSWTSVTGFPFLIPFEIKGVCVLYIGRAAGMKASRLVYWHLTLVMRSVGLLHPRRDFSFFLFDKGNVVQIQ